MKTFMQTVGLIIGKGGEMIQALQARSGAKIMVLSNNQDRSINKTVQITGTPAAIEKAKGLISETLDPMVIQSWLKKQGTTTEVLKIANDKVGLVIGKGI